MESLRRSMRSSWHCFAQQSRRMLMQIIQAMWSGLLKKRTIDESRDEAVVLT